MMTDQQTQPRITCRNLWKIFGTDPERVLQELDPNLSRAEVQKCTGHVIAVKNVSFEVQKGETFVVMGLSGSGKSTLVRCISRLVEPTSGEVGIDQDEIMAMNQRQLIDLRRHRMSMVFQHFGLLPHRRVLDNISYGLEVRGMAKSNRDQKAVEVLEMVGLDGWGDHYPRELSGGMQQRVGLARALAVDPEIMLFDEPFSALDPLIRREMQDELLKLQAVVRKTMVFITHDFLEAIKMGDHIAIMKDGEFVQVGTPEQIVANPIDDYVRAFSEDVPRHKVLTAHSIMKSNYPSVQANEKLESALEIMERVGVPAIFVLGPNRNYLGTLEIEKALTADSTATASTVATKYEPVSPTALVETLIARAAREDLPIPIVEDNCCLGSIDRSAIMLAMDSQPTLRPDQ
jgi:glycine betaine/proline transport system ATP-binding protein